MKIMGVSRQNKSKSKLIGSYKFVGSSAVHDVQPGSPNQCEIQPRSSEHSEQEVAAGPAWLRRRGVSGSVRLAEAELAVFAEMFCH